MGTVWGKLGYMGSLVKLEYIQELFDRINVHNGQSLLKVVSKDKKHGITFRLLMKARLMVITFTVIRNMEKGSEFQGKK